jgi:hypothetical protein
MAPRNLTRSARQPETMQHDRLETEERPLLSEDRCSDDHTTRKVKSFRDPSVGLTWFIFPAILVHDYTLLSSAAV